eukprot:TRINITY_DN3409_c1_g1_i1.p1 TRINITY_DN3409_c1_g1~~TRINITY_DN3409_c1_g1_i1.p1  ORF type:complete len:668 (+),score=258.29 TRINITY_DN3409_c1_g1_i1:36-2006(+)
MSVSSWLGGAAGKLLSGAQQYIGEVLAPSDESTPLDQFKLEWEEFKYSCTTTESDPAVQLEYAAGQLNNMMNILVEESQNKNKETDGDGATGPCLEHFLAERMMETLYQYGKTDSPRGLTTLVIDAFSTMLKEIKDPLIPTVNVHRTLQHLIVDEMKQVITDDIDHKFNYVSLLSNLASRLEVHPDFFSIFFDQGDFLVFSALLPYLNDSHEITQQQARKGILACLHLHKDEITEFIIQKSEFATVLTTGLSQHFLKMPESNNVGSNNTEPLAIEDFYDYATFVDMVAKSSHPDLQQLIADTIQSMFLEKVLQTRLLQASESAIVNATIHLSGLVEAFTNTTLLRAVVRFLLGDMVGKETQGQAKNHLVRKTIIHRIMYMDSKTSLATLQLFEDLINTCDQQVVYNLLLRNLDIQKLEGMTVGKDTTQNWLDLFAFTYDSQGSIVGGYDAYLLDVHQNMAYCKDKTQEWVKDIQEQIQAQANRSQSNEQDVGDESEETDPVVEDEGSFMSILLDKLEAAFENTLDENAVLTGVISKLAQLSVPGLFNFLLLPASDSDKRSLFSVMQKLSEEAKESSESVPDFLQVMDQARHSLCVDIDEHSESSANASGLSDIHLEWESLLQALIVLEEFCKEMGAIAQVGMEGVTAVVEEEDVQE